MRADVPLPTGTFISPPQTPSPQPKAQSPKPSDFTMVAMDFSPWNRPPRRVAPPDAGEMIEPFFNGNGPSQIMRRPDAAFSAISALVAPEPPSDGGFSLSAFPPVSRPKTAPLDRPKSHPAGLRRPTPNRPHLAKCAGNGLTTMQRRLQDIGGVCDIKSIPGQGTRVTFYVALKPAAGSSGKRI